MNKKILVARIIAVIVALGFIFAVIVSFLDIKSSNTEAKKDCVNLQGLIT